MTWWGRMVDSLPSASKSWESLRPPTTGVNFTSMPLLPRRIKHPSSSRSSPPTKSTMSPCWIKLASWPSPKRTNDPRICKTRNQSDMRALPPHSFDNHNPSNSHPAYNSSSFFLRCRCAPPPPPSLPPESTLGDVLPCAGCPGGRGGLAHRWHRKPSPSMTISVQVLASWESALANCHDVAPVCVHAWLVAMTAATPAFRLRVCAPSVCLLGGGMRTSMSHSPVPACTSSARLEIQLVAALLDLYCGALGFKEMLRAKEPFLLK
mmetsp:Transcript_48203/g.146583  ORF Transcript_48203/g.146583 Transcript_48203/m.146583 type:complete len:264 (-) Transcript_48203:661-1452(-)